MFDQEDNINLAKIVFDDNNQERNSWACVGQTCSRPPSFFFCFNFLYIWRLNLVAFGELKFQKRVTNRLFDWNFFVAQQATIYIHQDCEQINLCKNSCLCNVCPSFRDKKVTSCLQWAQTWNVSTEIWQSLVFLWTLTDTLRCYGKRNW